MWWDLWSTFKKVLKFPNLCCLPEPKSLSPHIQTCRTWKYLRFLISSFQTCGLEAIFFQNNLALSVFISVQKKELFVLIRLYVANFTKKSVQQFDSLNTCKSIRLILLFRILSSNFFNSPLLHLEFSFHIFTLWI